MVFAVILVSLFFFVAIEVIGMMLRPKQSQLEQKAEVVPFSETRLPRGLFVDEGHGWAWLTESGELRVGADEFLAQAVGSIDRVDLPAPGTKVSRGEPLATLHSGDRELILKSPVNGTVVATNDTVERSPDAMERDPYGTGWLAKVWPVEHTEALKNLKVGETAAAWLEAEVQRFVDFLARRTTPELVGATLPDGARPVVGAARALNSEDWKAFREEFLG